jgi:hypothetical protein
MAVRPAGTLALTVVLGIVACSPLHSPLLVSVPAPRSAAVVKPVLRPPDGIAFLRSRWGVDLAKSLPAASLHPADRLTIENAVRSMSGSLAQEAHFMARAEASARAPALRRELVSMLQDQPTKSEWLLSAGVYVDDNEQHITRIVANAIAARIRAQVEADSAEPFALSVEDDMCNLTGDRQPPADLRPLSLARVDSAVRALTLAHADTFATPASANARDELLSPLIPNVLQDAQH